MLFMDDLVLCNPGREMMEVRLERWRECMEKNGLKVSGHLQTRGDTDPVRMKRYMETVMVNLQEEEPAKTWRAEWSYLRQESCNEIEAEK